MKKPLIIAGVIGLMTALSIAGFLNSIESKYRKGAQKVNVLMAKEYLEQGTMLDETLVEVKQIPKEYLQPKALQSVKDLADADGQRLYMAQVPVEKGEQIVTTKLFMLGMDTGLSAVVPTDRRAVTIVFDREAVSGVVKPGNKVDIIGIFQYYDKNNVSQQAAITVLQNVQILGVGKSLLGQVKPVLKSKKDIEKSMTLESSENRIPISFSLSPVEAEILVLTAEKSSIKLSLRATGDEKIFASRGAKLNEIVKDAGSEKRWSDTGSKEVTPLQAEYMKQAQQTKEMQQRAIELLKKYQQQSK